MARYSYSGNKKHKKKQNFASEYLPYLINELSDEIEVVEQVLSGGEERQVLTADSAGKAQWAEGGGSGGGIEGIRTHENVVIVTGAGAPEINGLYIKIPSGETAHYLNSMRTIELVFGSDGYWFFHKFGSGDDDDDYYYGAEGTLDTPWAELVWEDWSGDFEQAPAPSPTIVSDTNYSGFAIFGDPVVADGEGGVKVIGNPNPLSEPSGGGGALASFSYEPGENETWQDLFVLYPAAAEALHLNLNEQQATVYIMLQLAESPYHMFEISRAFGGHNWQVQISAVYGMLPGDTPPSGTYNILSVRIEMPPGV